MTYRGRIENGAVVLDKPVSWPDGTPVEVAAVGTLSDELGTDRPTLYERLKDVIGAAPGLPRDFAEEHDHYVHGTPPRSRP